MMSWETSVTQLPSDLQQIRIVDKQRVKYSDNCTSVEDTDKTIYYKQVRKKKRSLHEATPRKGRKEPNRIAKRNNKNTKAVVSKGKKYALYDKVSYNRQVGWITGFTRF